MADLEPLVIHVGFGPLGDVLDPERLASIRPGIEVRTVHYDLPHEEHTRRSLEPRSPEVVEGEIELTDELRDALAVADIMLTLNAPLDLPTLAPRLRWIQAMGSGVGQFVPSRLPEGDIALTNAAGIGAVPIAEWVLARVLSVYKKLDEHAEMQRQHRWETSFGARLEGRRALVVGLGAIGVEVAKRLHAFGVTVVGVKRSYTPGMTSPDADELIGPDQLHDALGDAHLVVVAAPGTAANENLFDEKAFASMRRGSVFVNVARGNLVDEDALMAALRSGHLRAAAIDVARTEPLPPESPLWDTPNLTISPHSSASADQYLERVAELFYVNLERFVAGDDLLNVVDMSGGY